MPEYNVRGAAPAQSRLYSLALAALLFSPGAAIAAETTLRVEGLDMTRIEVRGAVQVEISAAPQMSLLVRGPEEDINLQPFHARENVLLLGYNPDARRHDFSQVRYKLALPVLTHLRVTGSGDVYMEPREEDEFTVTLDGSGDVRLHRLTARDLELHVNGSGDIGGLVVRAGKLDAVVAGSGDIRLDRLETGELELGIRGSGDIRVRSGSAADEASIAVVGSGDVDLSDLDIRHVEVSIVGDGDVRVGAAEELDVTILGSGDVHYAGDPEKNMTVLGSGSLHATDR